MKKKTVAVYIGRFQPLHIAHQNNIEQCIAEFDDVLVLVGSSNKRLSSKNPFTYEMRQQWIHAQFPKVTIAPLEDFIYNDTKWVTQVEQIVNKKFPSEYYEVTLVGYDKDASTYYLNIFPNFKYKALDTISKEISGSAIRHSYFTNTEYYKTVVAPIVADTMIQVRKDPCILDSIEEFEFYEKEKELFKNYPFPETLKFNCSDAVVICRGNILLIERKFAPGKGSWALPGGFVNQFETYQECAVRELFEETGLKVPEKVVLGSIVSNHVFDNPKRGIGIPRITNAFYFDIAPDFNGKLPKVKASDDAANAKWFSLAVVKNMKLYDDHKDIIDFFTGSF